MLTACAEGLPPEAPSMSLGACAGFCRIQSRHVLHMPHAAGRLNRFATRTRRFLHGLVIAVQWDSEDQ